MAIECLKIEVIKPVAAMVGAICCHSAGVLGVYVELEPLALKVRIQKTGVDFICYEVALLGGLKALDKLAEIDRQIIIHEVDKKKALKKGARDV